MNRHGEAARKAFERVLEKASAEKRELDAWECEYLRAALIMMAMNDDARAEQTIERCRRASPLVGANLQTTCTIEDMRACLAMLDHPHYSEI